MRNYYDQGRIIMMLMDVTLMTVMLAELILLVLFIVPVEVK